MSRRKKKRQPQFGPYATPAQGYDPNQLLFGQQGQLSQPMQQPYQPDHAEPATQPYQQPCNNQQGWPGQGF